MDTLLLLGAELLVVFLGVSLSFVVENLREERSELRSAKHALHGIADDLAAEAATVEWLISVYRPTAEAAEQLYLDWHQLPDTPEPAESVLYAIHIGAPYSPARAHYEAAKTSGSLSAVPDAAVRTAIASVFEQQQAFLRELSRITNEFDFEFWRRLRPYITYGPTTQSFEQQIVSSEGAQNGPVTLLQESISELRADQATRNALYHMTVFRKHFALLLEGYIERVRQLERQLRSESTRNTWRRAV